ncbi:MAG TPA: trypsin-like peptidase domain-containing protein, partial [Ferruginibacter sp.]|nr:trypsin-like peptidase domain-containing protein [Ferruginibacter sp.]
MTPINERLKSLLTEMAAQDPELMTELNDKRSSAALRGEALDITETLSAPKKDGTVESLTNDETGMEAVICRVGRPVLIINNSEIELAFEDPESEIWGQRLKNARQQLALSVPAVGRIGLKNHPALDWCGTGWLIDKDIVVTNRHVAEIFASSNGKGFTFRQGEDGGLMKTDIDLLQEYNRPDKRVMKLTKVLYIEPEPGPDIAFLAAEPLSENMPVPIGLSDRPVSAGSDVAVIGYPAIDSRMPDIELMRKIFKDVYDKKRLAPGKVTNVTASRLFHNCSTLGGCSGSAVIDLATGKACGLHFSGKFLQTNNAVPANVIAERLDAYKNKRIQPHVPVTENHKPDAGQQSITTGNVVSMTIPLRITVSLGENIQQTITTQVQVPAANAPLNESDEFILEGRAEDYADRKGYDEQFLGKKFKVPLPQVTDKKRKADLLTYKLKGKDEPVLRYQHFSVVMSKSRRQCLFSAVNIHGGKSKKASRVGWRLDPRIPVNAQIMHE